MISDPLFVDVTFDVVLGKHPLNFGIFQIIIFAMHSDPVSILGYTQKPFEMLIQPSTPGPFARREKGSKNRSAVCLSPSP